VSGLRLTVSAALGAASVVLAMVSPAFAATAATNITILSAGPDSSGDPYNLTVTASDTNAGGTQITSMTAHVFSASNQDVADPTMTYVSGPPTAQVWVANPPIAESALPAGTYTVTVDASDPTPEIDNGLAAGSFSFAYATSSLTVTAAPTSVTQGSQQVTFSGKLTGTAPGGIPVGIANVPVNLTGATSNPVATTGSGVNLGNFSYVASGVAPGTYSFTVGVTGQYPAASATVSVPVLQSTLTVTPTPASVTEGSQTVTFTGQLTGASPSGGPAVAIQNAPVDVSINGKPATQITTTDVNGDFTYNVGGISKTTVYTFGVAQTTNYAAATNAVLIGVIQAQTRISHIRVTPAHLKYGQNATLRATVQYLSGNTWTALPRTAVHLAEGGTRLPTVTTASNGAFTATLPSTHGPSWSAVVNAGNLTLQTSAMGDLSIALPLAVSSFSAQLGVNDKISASGCLEVQAPFGAGPGTFVDIQYSGTARGPWRSLGRLPLHNGVGRNRTCRSHGQSSFRGTLPAKRANAYYRADFAATYSYQAAVSKVVHAWKYPTRIVSFTANKHSISQNGTVRFRGKLEVRVKSWKPWGGQKVAIWYNYKGTPIFVWLANATTNSRGYFTATAYGSIGNFVTINYAIYAGNATHLACRSRGVAVRISNRGATAGPAAAGSTPPPLDLAELERLPPLAIPLLPALTAWPSIAPLARTKP
jgi:hypothetical protein